jgi:hypothetical protein
MEPPVQISSRKDFLWQPAVMLASAALISLEGEAESAGAWYDRPMGRAQLMLKDDPGNYDLQFPVGYFRRPHSDVACLFAGGCVGYYPIKVPFVPEGRCIRRVSLLVSRKAPAYRVAGNLVSMHIPSIDLHEVVALDPAWKGAL